MKFFLVVLLFIAISHLTTTYSSDIDEVLKLSHVNCPLDPYSPISICSAVPEMSPTLYFRYAKKCLDGPLMIASYLRKEGKPSEDVSKEMNEKDGDTGNDDKPSDEDSSEVHEKDQNFDNDVDPHSLCVGCLCAHFLARFPHEQQRAWILGESWATGISVSLSHFIYICPFIYNTNSALPLQDQPTTVIPSAPLAEWVLDPHTEVSIKGIPKAESLGLALKRVPEVKEVPKVGSVSTGMVTAILIMCASLGAGLLGMQVKDSLLDQFG